MASNYLTGSECGVSVSELAFDLNRCLRKYKINNPTGELELKG
jgi:hypothetical protein